MAKAAPVERVNLRQLRTQLRSIMRADHPTIGNCSGPVALVILPTGAMDWQHRWDWAFQRRQLARHFAAALKLLDKDE